MKKILKLKFENILTIYFILVLGLHQLNIIQTLLVAIIGYLMVILVKGFRETLLTEYEFYKASLIVKDMNNETKQLTQVERLKRNIQQAERI